MLRFIFLVKEVMEEKKFEEFNLEKLIKSRINEIDNNKEWFKYDFETLDNKNLVIFVTSSKYNNYNLNINENYNLKLYFKESVIENFWWDVINTKAKIKFLIFNDCDFNTKIIWWKSEKSTFIYNELWFILKEFQINYSNNNNLWWILIFYNFLIDTFTINNQNKKNIKFDRIKIYNNVLLKNLLIDNIEISELILENINNNFESFEIRNCKIDKLIIKNSNLWKAVFNWVEIWELEIENVTLNDCIFNWVDFKTYELEEIKNGDSVNYKVMKDNYRQLKHVMDKNANYTEANEFYSLEMEYYRLYLTNWNYKKGLLQNLTNNFFGTNIENSWKYLILNFLWLINNFWNNIYRNIFTIYLYLFLVTIISFTSNNYKKSDIFYSIEFTQILRFLILFLVIYFIPVLFSVFLKKIKKGNLIVKIDNFISSSNFTIITHIIIVIFLLFLLNVDVNRFHWIETFIYLINPFSWLTPNSMSHLLWSEKLWMIIHKIIYWILIYQLIIALKRTTRR